MSLSIYALDAKLVINTVLLVAALLIGLYILLSQRFNTERLDSQCAIGFFMVAFAGWLTAGFVDPKTLHYLNLVNRTLVVLGFFCALHVLIRHNKERSHWKQIQNSCKNENHKLRAKILDAARKTPTLFDDRFITELADQQKKDCQSCNNRCTSVCGISSDDTKDSTSK